MEYERPPEVGEDWKYWYSDSGYDSKRGGFKVEDTTGFVIARFVYEDDAKNFRRAKNAEVALT